MAAIRFCPSLATGIAEIDDQHKHIIGLFNDLHEAAKAAKGGYLVQSMLRELRLYTTSHFECERQWMERHRYPQLQVHQREHANLVSGVRQFETLHRHGSVSAEELLEFLKEWLLDHIARHDLAFAAFVKKAQPGSRASSSGCEAADRARPGPRG